MTVEEQSAFINFVKNNPRFNHWYPIFATFLGTGCRLSELIGLRWRDVDFDNNVVIINHNTIYGRNKEGVIGFYITTPKTQAGIRNIPMLDEVKEALIISRDNQKVLYPWQKRPVIDGCDDWVFQNTYGTLYREQNLNHMLKRIISSYNEQEKEKALSENRKEVLLPDFCIHTLRHTFATRFCENETNIKVIQAIMGHSDIATTMNVYAEATEKKKNEVMINLQGKIDLG